MNDKTIVINLTCLVLGLIIGYNIGHSNESNEVLVKYENEKLYKFRKQLDEVLVSADNPVDIIEGKFKYVSRPLLSHRIY